MTAKEFLQDRNPYLNTEDEWDRFNEADDNWTIEMMTEYSEHRTKEFVSLLEKINKLAKVKINTDIDTYHVTPVNDIKKHSESGCDCNPTIDIVENGNVIIVHNSFDGREEFE